FIIAFGAKQRVDQRARAAFGPQPQIHAKTKTLFRHIGDKRARLLHNLREKSMGLDAAGGLHHVIAFIEKAQIDITAWVELPAAEFSHAKRNHGNHLPLLIGRISVASSISTYGSV